MPEREIALLELIDTETRQPHQVSDEQIEKLRSHDWSDEQIFEAVWVAAAFAYMTRIVEAFGINWTPDMVDSRARGLQPDPQADR